MCQMGELFGSMNETQAYNFIQTYSLNKGLQKFGEKGRLAALKEMKQLHDHRVWEPIRFDEMTKRERKQAMESLVFLTEKRDKTIKAQTCANGSRQRPYTPKEEAASLTAATEAILITGVIDAKQKQDIMTLDVPNAFVQTDVQLNGEKIVMKIRSVDRHIDRIEPRSIQQLCLLQRQGQSSLCSTNESIIWDDDCINPILQEI